MKLPTTFTYKGKTYKVHPDLKQQLAVAVEDILSGKVDPIGCDTCLKEDPTSEDKWCTQPTPPCKSCLFSGEDNGEAIKAFFQKYKSCFITGDAVNHPSHYKCHAMESIDEMIVVFGEEAVYYFCICNAWKYRYRAGHKDDAEQDAAKSDWYIKKAKELKDKLEGKEKKRDKKITLKAIEQETEDDEED